MSVSKKRSETQTLGEVLQESLFSAIGQNDVDAVRKELDRGVDPNIRDVIECTPLAYAAVAGNLQIFELLIERGADPLVKASGGKGTAGVLHSLASNGWTEWVQKIIALGADPGEAEDNGATPLHWAASEGRLDICRLLLDHGVAIDTVYQGKFNAGIGGHMTPLHFAAKHGRSEVCKFLVGRGAKLSATAEMGRTPLHIAAENGSVATCRALVEAGASPSFTPFKYDWYQTPFQHAIEKGKEEVVRFFLLECGESLTQKTAAGKTMAQLARKHQGLYQRLRMVLRSDETVREITSAIDPQSADEAPVTPRRISGMSPL